MKKILLLTAVVIILPSIIVTIFTSTDNQKYYYIQSQEVRVKNEKTGKITKVPLEEYTKGVLAGEMPASFNIEALKAQAVAARSYVLIKIKENKKDYDVVNTTKNQVYLTDEELKNNWKEKYNENISKITKAINETKGEYLTYNGQIANTLFFSTSSGETENSEDVFISKVPYLRSVSSKWDEKSPKYEELTTITLEEFYRKLNLEYNAKLNIEIKKQSKTGRPKIICINGTDLKTRDIASTLGLKSNYLTITQNENSVNIITKGFGHGVGMSQYGANGMAEEGYNYKEILKHYYTNTQIKKI